MRVQVQKTIFENKDNGFCVLVFSTKDKTVPENAQTNKVFGLNSKVEFVGTGYYLPTKKGIELEVDGNWEDGKKGLQLVIEQFSEVIPKTTAGIIGYLSSGLIKGIGENRARTIVAKFGLKTLEIIENDPAQLLQIKGISQKKLDEIVESYRSSQSLREIVAYVSPFGISVSKAAKIQKEFSGRAMEILEKDPFQLCSISGFGFKTVDQIARATNCGLRDPLRIRGAVLYVLEEELQNGNLFTGADALAGRADFLLNDGFQPPMVAPSEIKQRINLMVQSGELIYEGKALYLPKPYEDEKAIAEAVARLLTMSQPKPVTEAQIAQAQKSLGVMLSPAQCSAVAMALSSNISVLTGGPGTGKTTTLRVVLEAYKQNGGGEVLLTAPTGRAGRRMAESCGEDARTLHSALGLMSDDDYNDNFCRGDSPDADFIIVDETSMVDNLVGAALFTRMKKGARILLVGDADQLPPVGPGCVFKDLIASGLIPVTRLETIYRQAEGSRIALNAHEIKKGGTKLLYGKDFEFVSATSAEAAAKEIYNIYRREAAAEGIENVQILSPYRKSGQAGVNAMNPVVREIANPASSMRLQLQHGPRIFRVGDKVLQVRNKDEISNGDVGFINDICTDEDKGCSVTVEFTGERVATYGPDNLELLDLAYAMSVHKSQGSEYATVIVPVLFDFYVMLKRDIYYTGITRAKKKVILVGQKQALFKAIHTMSEQRHTRLSQRINLAVKERMAAIPEEPPEQLKIG